MNFIQMETITILLDSSTLHHILYKDFILPDTNKIHQVLLDANKIHKY